MTPAIAGLAARLSGCRGVLVDSNILLDVGTNDFYWSEWSTQAIAEIADHTILVINPIVYAEISVRYATIEALDEQLSGDFFERVALPWQAAFLAGRQARMITGATLLIDGGWTIH